MLAAVSSEKDNSLGTLKLILQMEAAEQKYSGALENYLMEVVQQALQLIEHPERHTGSALVEALSLALHLKSDQKLRQSLESILEGGTAKAGPASVALERLENRFDARREPAYFGRGVYAAL